MMRQKTYRKNRDPDELGRRGAKAAVVAGLVLVLASCAGQRTHRMGMDQFATGHYDEGLASLAKATREAPDNAVYRMSYLNARARLVGRLLGEATQEQEAGRLDAAESLYRHAERLDPDGVEVRAGLDSLAQARRHADLVDEARRLSEQGQLDAAMEKLRDVLKENPGHVGAKALRQKLDEQAGRIEITPPSLAEAFRTPVRLEFRDAALKQVLEALSHYGGLNFVIDKEVPDNLQVVVSLRDISLVDAIDLILASHQLRRRVLSENTLLIYPDTAAKLGEHQELIVKTIFLNNANAKQVETMLKTMLKMRNVYVDERLNLLAMRDTPEAIRLASRIVATQDVSDPEVMLEVAIVEVKRSSLLNLGIQFPDQLSLTPLASGKSVTLLDLNNLNSSSIGATVTPLTLNLHDDNSVTNLLANPRIRTRNREKAMIKIGDRVPVITTTATSTGFVSENVQYIDVGLMLEVEPTIYPDDEVAIKLNLEVSSVVNEIISKAGTISYQIGGRNASTVIRLKNGETQVLGGLINDEDRRTANRFPGLSQFPLIGRLFSSESDNNSKTELVLSITPRVIRSLAPPVGVPAEFWSGTENSPRLRDGWPSIPPMEVVPRPAETLPQSPDTLPQPPVDMPPPVAPEPPVSPGADAGSSATPVLSWSGPSRVRPGDTFKLVLGISGAGKISAIPLRMNFDKTVFKVVEVAPGPIMARDKKATDVAKCIENGYDLVMLNQKRPVRPAGVAAESGDLAVLTLRALRPATTSRVRVLSSDPLGQVGKALGVTAPAVAEIHVQA